MCLDLTEHIEEVERKRFIDWWKAGKDYRRNKQER